MNGSHRRWFAPSALVLIMLCAILPPPPSMPTVESLMDFEEGQSNVIGQATTLSIGSWPDGANERISIDVPTGEAIQSLNLSLEAATLSQSTSYAWTEAADFGSSQVVYDGMDVNGSALRLLPQGASWDFESPNHGWTVATPWFVGYDTTLGATNGVHSGAAALYTYDGNYPNNMAQFWATSPVVDCTGCSGSWSLSYWKRLGVESSTWDHAYVQVKNPSGSWVTIWSNSGTINDAAFFQMTHDISSYVAGNSNFQLRYGLGTSDSSVTYTGWNIDDIEIMPTTGISNGEGNWTSPIISPSLTGRGEERTYGLLHMDATIDPNAVFEWQIIDATTGTAIPGFEHLTSTVLDLGMIDWVMYPSIRMKVHMKQVPGAGASEIRSISIDGGLNLTFDADPSSQGWLVNTGTWSNGAITSSDTILSPLYKVRGGFSHISTTLNLTGSATLLASIDGEDWTAADSNGNFWLNEPHYSVQFKIEAASASITLDEFDAELIRTSVPVGVRFDIGVDGVAEWGLDSSQLSSFGNQQLLSDGHFWQTKPTSPVDTAGFEFMLPTQGVSAFEFGISSQSNQLLSPFFAIEVDGDDVVSRSFSNLLDLQLITLTDSELSQLNAALYSAKDKGSTKGLPMTNVEVRVGSALSSSNVQFGGLFAPFEANITANFDGRDALISALNHQLTDIVAQNGVKSVKLPLRMDGTGSVRVTVNELVTQASVAPISLNLKNVSDTLTPSAEWIESQAIFDFSGLGVSDGLLHARQSGYEVELSITGEHEHASIRCPMVGLPLHSMTISSCTTSGHTLMWFDAGISGIVSATGAGTFVQVDHRFKFPDAWNDESSAILSVALVSQQGPMIPLSYDFGLGTAQGVENDLEVRWWAPVSQLGIPSSEAYPYLRPGEAISIEVQLGFENGLEGTPRSGQALVRLLIDGNEYATTTTFVNGKATFPYAIPSGRTSLEIGIEVLPMRGQDVTSEMVLTNVYRFDTTAPMLISSDVDTFDTRDAAPATSLKFSIADQPNLPTYAFAHLWRSWQDDTDGNGMMSESEMSVLALDLPSDLSQLYGEYELSFSTEDAVNGDYFLGWLVVADSAGNIMEDSGNVLSPLFHVQINANGAPSIGAKELAWSSGNLPWVHPEESTVLSVPIWEQNGIYDLSEIQLTLDSNTPMPAIITWNHSMNTCSSDHMYIEIHSCDLVASDQDDLFSRNGEFVVNFTLEWGFDPDTSLIRIPSIQLKDQTGQSNQFRLEPLGWRFSGEVMIQADSFEVSLAGENPLAEGYWVQPRTVFSVQGDLVWTRTNRLVNTPLELELRLGTSTSAVQTEHGRFEIGMIAPLGQGTYGLYGDLLDAPNGAVYRGDESAFAWFIVDNEAPQITAVDSPISGLVLEEGDWAELEFELRLSETARIDETSLLLHWSINEAGKGLNSQVFDNGSLPLHVVGDRLSGHSIPVHATLDLDRIMIQSFRTQSVELRIWVTGQDEAGHPITSTFNDIDAPLRVWMLEQRVPTYSISSVELKPSSQIHQGDRIAVGSVISNTGLADGEAQVVLEQVESDGARRRLDARNLAIGQGESVIYSYNWKPTRDGTMWLELTIVNGPSESSSTVFVNEPRADGVMGSISEVNSNLLIIIGLVILGLLGVLMFGTRSPSHSPVTLHQEVSKDLPSLELKSSTPSSTDVYGGSSMASPGENPYQ